MTGIRERGGMSARAHGAYARRHPERTALCEVVRDNLDTLYGAIPDGLVRIS